MSCRISSHANLEVFRQEARNLLHDLQWQDPTAMDHYYSLDPAAGTFRARLTDAQYIIARKYGFPSWQKLVDRLLATHQTFPITV
jgi:hypothetical protein